MPESKSRKKPAKVPRPGAPEGSTPAKLGNPTWLVPTMLGLMIFGLVWIVVTYLFSFSYPIPGIGAWNLAAGFAFVIAGFALTTRWK